MINNFYTEKTNFKFLKKTEDGTFEVYGIPLKRIYLNRLIKRAQRNGILYKCLNIAELRFLKLVIKLVDKVRSFTLAKVLTPMIKKLLEALKTDRELLIKVLGEVNYWIKTIGRTLVEKIVKIAQSWGNKFAHEWINDEGFIKYLVVTNLPELRKQVILNEGIVNNMINLKITM
ncbi:MAG: hypothetical protein QXI49_04920 [Candidatus Methanomethylicaceae archaeon]